MHNFHKKEAPLLGLQGLGGGLGFLAGGGVVESLYSDDVFSVDVWSGNGNARNINTGLDMSGEGGMVWLKRRNGATNPMIYDTERGTYHLETDGVGGQSQFSQFLTGYRNDGYSIGTATNINGTGTDSVGWSFRKAPGFFDVVTYTGNGSNTGDSQTLNHSLGSTPGFVIIKRTNDAGDWVCWHRSISTGQPRKYIELDSQNGTGTMGVDIWGTVSSTGFEVKHNGTVGDSYEINKNGESYVAYFFAHDDQSFGTSSDQSIIKCGSFTGANHTESLGFEPQWLLAKRTDSSTLDWYLVDNMRGFYDKDAGDSVNLRPNTNNDENTAPFHLNSDGFYYSSSSATYIYVAIRRPHKPPTLATNVFNILNDVGSGSSRIITAGNLVDLQISKSRNGTGVNDNWYWLTRIQNNKHLSSDSTSNENTTQTGSTTFDEMDGMSVAAGDGWTNASPFGGPYIRYFLTRATGFFDIVTYSGNSTAGRTIPHNLEVKPELMIVKARSGAANQNWFVYNSNDTATDYMMLNDVSDSQPLATVWNNTEPTSSVFSVGGSTFTNATNYTYIAYLFATLDGISKVGTYAGAGSGNSVDVDCGFSAAPRFVMIKDTGASGNWYVYDSVRGIVSGNDPILFFDANASEQTAADDIDPLNSGFRVVSNNSGLNTSGRTYLFLAIA